MYIFFIINNIDCVDNNIRMTNFNELPSNIYLSIYEFIEVNKKTYHQKKNIIKSKKSNDPDFWVNVYGDVTLNMKHNIKYFKDNLLVFQDEYFPLTYKVKKKAIQIFPTIWKDIIEEIKNEHIKEGKKMFINYTQNFKFIME